MPVYAYKCRDCGTPLEAHQEFSDAPLTECPVCGGVLRKQYGSIGVTFNGSGFYRNDSRAGSGDAAKPSESKGDSKSESKGDSKGESSSSSSSSAPAPKTDGGSKPAAAPSAPAAS